jgi:YggT family protein
MGLYLIKILFDLYLYVVILRLLLQLIHADYRNPLSQFTIKYTQPLLTPLQKFIPSYKNIDLAVVTLALLVEILKLILLMTIAQFYLPHVGVILAMTVADIFEKIIMVYFYAIIARILLSWIMPLQQSPITFIINKLTEPLLARIRKVVPLLAGIDLSPLFALILLQVLSIAGMQIIGITVEKLL